MDVLGGVHGWVQVHWLCTCICLLYVALLTCVYHPYRFLRCLSCLLPPCPLPLLSTDHPFPAGSYSSNVNLAVENSSWSDEQQLQEMYLSRKSFAFNSDRPGAGGEMSRWGA